jgi:putative peptide zinc metalloprotease protein
MNASPQRPDFAVREIEVSAPRVRDGLRWTFQEVGGEGSYLLEDPLHGRFFRLGRREHHFVKCLDGRRTIAKIVAHLSTGDPALALEATEATSLVRMLIDNGLVVSGDSEHADRVWDEVNRPHESKRMLGRMGQLLFLKIPLGNPDRFFSWLARKAGWLASPGFALVWLIIVGWGAAAVGDQSERFRAQMSGVFNFGNLWILGGLWAVLKIFHECWHGLVCRKHGGAVPEAGITLMLLTTPLGYVNASSSTAFPSKWQRIAVAGAGIYGELLIAAIAAILWARAEPGPLSAALHQVVVLSSVTTLLFNANPLMRFDGYYILSDLLEIPNLYSKGQSASRWLFRRWILGMNKAKNPLRPGDPAAIILLYGIASGIWRILVTLGLLVAATLLFEGLGLALAVVAAATMIIQGIAGTVIYLKKSAAAEGLRPLWLLFRVAALAGCVIAALCLIRVTPTASAPAVVQDASGGEIRAECPGFLTEIAVPDGSPVEAGALLFRLENAGEMARLSRLESEIERSRLRSEQFLAANQLAAWQAETRNLASLETSAAELRAYTASLERRAPRAGIVQSRNLDSLEGTWVEPGQLLMTVGTPERKELVILAAQDDWQTFEEAHAAGRPLLFRPRGRWDTATATIRTATASATTQPAHFGLITPGGGPLTVRKAPGSGADSDGLGQYSLSSPRFEIRADLQPDQAAALLDGEPGITVVSASAPETLASLGAKELSRRWDRLWETRAAQ